ncbi:MAG: hypothetical protein QMD77_01660 [Patescibacteria group bacterium]|nr:hypothetical protein [Patescibacteria group bacterium]
MLSQELKELIRDVGGKFIIAENGKARYVVMSFNEFQKSVSGRKPVQTLTEEELVDKINADIALWRENQASEDESAVEEIENLDDIEYETLPR